MDHKRRSSAGPAIVVSAPVRDVLGERRFCRWAGVLGFPGLAHLFAPREHIFLGILEVLVEAITSVSVEREALGHPARIFRYLHSTP